MSTVNAGWRGPNIVKEGLVLYLDAASGTSYSPYTSGNTWRDISGNGNNGTLTNGPSYSSGNGGSFVFDGTNDYMSTSCVIEAATSSNLQTYCSWLNGITSNNSFFGSDANGLGKFHLILKLQSNGTQLQFAESRYGGGGGALDQTNVATISSNAWNFACIVKKAATIYDVYFNGSIVISNATKSAELPANFNLGRLYLNEYAPSTISNVQIYNRALSASEVLQNYNSVKSRFGL
jgi:hypothetical protein